MEPGVATGQRCDDSDCAADGCRPKRGCAGLGHADPDLSQLAIGERIQHELLVVDRVERTQGNGDPFVLLTLGNASGSIGVAPIWSNQRG